MHSFLSFSAHPFHSTSVSVSLSLPSLSLFLSGSVADLGFGNAEFRFVLCVFRLSCSEFRCLDAVELVRGFAPSRLSFPGE